MTDKRVIPAFPPPVVHIPAPLVFIDTVDDPILWPRRAGWQWYEQGKYWGRMLRFDADTETFSVSVCLDQVWDGAWLSSTAYMTVGEMGDFGGDMMTIEAVAELIASLSACRDVLAGIVATTPARRPLKAQTAVSSLLEV